MTVGVASFNGGLPFQESTGRKNHPATDARNVRPVTKMAVSAAPYLDYGEYGALRQAKWQSR
jgi:hypothetical protein